MSDIRTKIEELSTTITENENVIASLKTEMLGHKKQIKKLERIEKELAEITV